MFSVGIDIGTTSCKLSIYSDRLIHSNQLVHNAHIDQVKFPSFDEQSAERILQTVERLFEQSEILNQVSSIKSIQVCGQMHGIIFWSSKSPRTIVSSLITWQDQRCSDEFLHSLDSSLKHLKTGFGLSSLMWLIKQNPNQLDQYDRAGTIADYYTFNLCDSINEDSTISTQMATSWGSIDDNWPIEHRLLPKIVQPGTVVGYFHGMVPVYVALGDLQCSVFSCQPNEHQGVINISTSAQLAILVEEKKSSKSNINSSGDHLSSSVRVPYFNSKDLLVAASLNGGNVLSLFVNLVHSWQKSLSDESSTILSIDQLWSRLIELALQSPLIENDCLSAALFGERHDPSLSASVQNIRSINLHQFNNIGSIFRSICHWIIQNLFRMLGSSSTNIQSVIGTGTALIRNKVLQEELKEIIKDQLILNDKCDAALGAALFASMK